MAHVPLPPSSGKLSLAASISANGANDARASRHPIQPLTHGAPTTPASSKARRRGRSRPAFEASIIEEAVIRRRLKVNVRSCRKAAGLTLKVVSERADMHWRHWQKIEAGQVNATLHTLVRVAEALAVEPFDLVREPQPRRPGT